MESSTPTSSQDLLGGSQEFGCLSEVDKNSQNLMEAVDDSDSLEIDSRVKKISNIDAWNLLHEVNTQLQAAEQCVETFTGSKITDLTGEDLELCGHLIIKIQNRFSRLQRAFKCRKIKLKNASANETFLAITDYEEFKILCKSFVIEEECTEIFDDTNVLNIGTQTVSPPVTHRGSQTEGAVKPRKPLHQLKDKKQVQERGREESLALEKFCTVNGISMAQALGFFLKKHYYNVDKKLADIGQKLFEDKDLILISDVPELTALHLLERLRIGRGQYTNMRLVLLRLV